MNFSKTKIDYIKILIFIFFCISIISSKHNLSSFDKYKIFNDHHSYHAMIKYDVYRHFSHGAEIKKDLDNGVSFFNSGRQHFTKYLPPKIAAPYYYFFDYDLFNNWNEKKINLGIHFNYLLIQCLIYYVSLFFLYSVISKKIPKKICLFIIIFLGLEPTIFQYHGTFWTESIFFSLQLLILALIIRNKNTVLNFFLIGLLLGLLSEQRSPAFFYIIPVITYFLIFLKKEIYYKILFLVVGYSLILSFVGYHNYVRAGIFYVLPNEVRTNTNLYLLQSILDEEQKISETKLALDWIEQNQIEIDMKEVNKDYSISTFNFKDNYAYTSSFCEGRYIQNEKDKIKFCDYIRSRTLTLITNNPISTLKYIIKNSIHFMVLNPFHIYSDHRFASGEIYYKSTTHKKFIPYRIVYTLLIFFIIFVGFLKLLKKDNKELITILLLSSLYFFIAISWHGNTRYFVPVLIYLSVFFGNGAVSIIDFFSRKITN